MIHRRRGSTLLELLIAIPLLALLATLALMLLLTTQRAAQRTDRTLAASHELRHAAAVLASEFRSLHADDLLSWSDSSIEVSSTVGTGIICAARGPRTRIVVTPTAPALYARTSWRSAAQPDDDITLFLAPDDSSFTPQAFHTKVRSIATAAACAGAPLLDSSSAPLAPAVVVQLTDTLPTDPATGTPVRLHRRTRYSLYASAGHWYLGRSELGPAGWDIVQPVAGPFRSMASRGLFLTVRNTRDAILAAADSSAQLVRVELRAPIDLPQRAGTPSPPRTDSILFVVALRGGHRGAP